MTIAASTYREIRRIDVANLGSDYDPTIGDLPPDDEWLTVGAADSLGAFRVVGIFVDGDDVQVPGGDWDWRPVEPAEVDTITSASGVNNALAIYGDEITGLEGGQSYLIDGIQAGSMTVCTTGGTAPVGASQLVILARKV